jgi:phosphopantothenoylcysteine synthetase/decarboxylase
MQFLVTAGNTREAIDRVRDWGNVFTGNTGKAIAQALSRRGRVDLLTSNLEHARELTAEPNDALRVARFRTHADLREALAQRLQGPVAYDAVFMTAAVADYAPTGAFRVLERHPLGDGREAWTVQDVSAGKVKSDYDAVAFLGRRTQKLIDLFRTEWGYRGLLVKFKLEVGTSEERLVEIAEASRRASGADYIVANTLEMVSGAGAGAWLLGEAVRERVARADLPERLARLV